MKSIFFLCLTIFLYSFPMKKGDFATIRNNDIKWAEKFKIIEVGDSKFKTNNIKLFYDWLVGFYFFKNNHNTPFVNEMLLHKKEWTLNPYGPFIHCSKNGYYWCREYYYNFGNREVINKKINYLKKIVTNGDFNGIFFDWAYGGGLYQKEYNQIHTYFKELNPFKTYLQTIEDFYKKLKQEGVFFVTNQAFRKESLLKFTSYDMTESYITTIKYISKRIMIDNQGIFEKVPITNYYPIDNKTLKATLFYIDKLTKLKRKYKKYGFKNFIFLNYLAPKFERIYPSQPLYKIVTPKNGIYFAFAMAKLTNNIEYAEVAQNPSLEKDEIYFYDLGEPLDNNYTKLKNLKIYVRYYTNGFVLVSDSYKKDKTISLKIKKPFYDIYNKRWINNSKIRLNYETDTFTNHKLPLGRVFVYR